MAVVHQNFAQKLTVTDPAINASMLLEKIQMDYAFLALISKEDMFAEKMLVRNAQGG